MSAFSGLDVLSRNEFAALRGKSIALVCNQASIDRSLSHILDLLLPYARRGDMKIVRVFGPQHGPYGHTQDDMIEWEGYLDPRTGLEFVSLYGERRKPTEEMLEGVDLLVADLQDVGARYYTFLWTLFLCMQACEPLGVPMMVLDRPNPLGGIEVEGLGVERGFESFVGLHSLPMRHGLTVGEACLLLRQERLPNLRLEVVQMDGWKRGMAFEETGLPWAAPSPNMPTVSTAWVYPGMCLLEGANLSEGRGTTQPFELFGAPFLESWPLVAELESYQLPGVVFRAAPFQPSFQKHAGQLCGGARIHVVDRSRFRPALTGFAALKAARRLAPKEFGWKPPPYEYEETLMPIDILGGGEQLRKAVESDASTALVRELFESAGEGFAARAATVRLYA